MSKLNEIIVSQLPIQLDIKPCTAYLLDNGNGTHDRYVSDEDGNLSKLEGGIKSIVAGSNITIDNTDPKNPIISSTGGGSSNETDPIFSASPSATITNSDINNWNNKLSAEVDTLQSVTTRGNSTDKELLLNTAPLGYNPTTYQFRFGGQVPNINTGQFNTSMGLGSLYANTSGARNTAFGAYALYTNQTSPDNTAIGYQSLMSLTNTVDWNTAVGGYTGRLMTSSENTTIIGTGVMDTSLASWRDTAIGAQAMHAYQGQVAYVNNRGFSRARSGRNVAVGEVAMYNTINGYGNTAIGWDAGGNFRNKGDYNVFIGHRAAALTVNTWGDSNVVIGANPPINAGGNGRLIIHSSSDINESDGSRPDLIVPLVSGNFFDRWFSIGGKILLNTTYTPNSQGDSTFTKTLTAKPDGTIGWEDKTTVTEITQNYDSSNISSINLNSSLNSSTSSIKLFKTGKICNLFAKLPITTELSGQTIVFSNLPIDFNPENNITGVAACSSNPLVIFPYSLTGGTLSVFGNVGVGQELSLNMTYKTL